MSTTPTVPEISVNTPAADIAAANVVSQATPTPGQPVATPEPTPAPVVAGPTPENPVIVTDIGGGKFKAQYLTGETFEGNAAEVISKTGQAHVNTKLWAKNQIQQAQTPTPTPTVPQSPFTDPAEKATADYVMDLVAKNMGLPNGAALKAQLGFMEANTTDYASQTTALQFQAMQPDFNPTPDNSAKMMQVISQSMPDEEFGAKNRDQQIQIMRQAHAFCLMSKMYDPKPAVSAPVNVPAPPPPPPGGRTAMPEGQLPENLRATLADTPDQIKAKWQEAVRLGYS